MLMMQWVNAEKAKSTFVGNVEDNLLSRNKYWYYENIISNEECILILNITNNGLKSK